MVIHILRDGTRLDDISGHIVKGQEAEAVYNLMDAINKGEQHEQEVKSNH
jgi:hypothetical protein